MHSRVEMLELVTVEGKARGIITRHLVSGRIARWAAEAVVLATGGYGNVFYLSTNAMGCNVTAAYRTYKQGALFANPCFTQIHPTCIPVAGEYQSKLTLMSESLRNDGRIWVPKVGGEDREPAEIPEEERDYYLERKYPAFGNLSPRDISSRAAKEVCDEGRGIGTLGRGVYLDFKDAIARVGADTIKDRYGNLFDMYQKITGENPYERPMRIYPASHYTMGGLWVDYNLMSTIEGLFVMGEANFSDHGANRLGASALMQGLADGYFVIADSIGNYLGTTRPDKIDSDLAEFRDAETRGRSAIQKLLDVNGTHSVDSFHKELGNIMWEHCGMARNQEGLTKAIGEIAEVRDRFWRDVRVTGANEEFNVNLEQAGRVADFLEFAEVLCYDALDRDESCGAHFREEHQTPDGEAKRNDEEFTYVAAWEFAGVGNRPALSKEPLVFENVELSTRSYK